MGCAVPVHRIACFSTRACILQRRLYAACFAIVRRLPAITYCASSTSVFASLISSHRFRSLIIPFRVCDNRMIARCSCTVPSWGRARVSDHWASHYLGSFILRILRRNVTDERDGWKRYRETGTGRSESVVLKQLRSGLIINICWIVYPIETFCIKFQ